MRAPQQAPSPLNFYTLQKKLTPIKTPALALLSLCTLGLGACQDEYLADDTSRGNVKIVARIDDGGMHTRTCVGNTTADGTVGIYWTPGDIIGVYGNGGTANAGFTSTNATAAPTATFAGNLKDGERPLYAYYPYDAGNASAAVSAIRGELKAEQAFEMGTGKIECDYKAGTPIATTGNGQYEFTFEHLFSLLKFDIDATGTALEGDRLESIVLTLPESRRLCGSFTFNASTKAVTWDAAQANANTITMTWSDRPELASGRQYTGYITCAPDIREGDEIRVTILTANYKAEFTRTALTDFAANTCYTFPLQLENYAADMEVTPRPVIQHFSFEVADNSGKILDKKLVYGPYEVAGDRPGWWPGGGTTTVTGTHPESVTEETLTIGEDSITGCIPYLYDFKLKPTFTVADGVEVTVAGKRQTSGESEQDFSRPVVYTVTSGGESRDYVVKVTNTGLPVVVLTQGSDGTRENWTEAGITVRSKESDWGNSDHVTVYNADGSVDMEPALCGSRLRGNSTQGFPKKPLALKFDEKVGPLGMPTDKRWVLLANWMDRTMLRNSVAFKLAWAVADAAEDGLGWNPRGKNVELVVDGRHVGNYLLCEQIKIDGDRVDINDCYEDVVDGGNASPTVADCGYLLEIDPNMDETDKFYTERRGLPVMFKDEVPDDLFTAVRDRINGIEANLYNGDYAAAYEDLDVASIIDWFFVEELTLNNEYKHPNSAYMYMNGTGKLTAGPVWDFDWQTFTDYDRVKYLADNHKINEGWNPYARKNDEWLYSASLGTGTDEHGEHAYYMWYPLLFKDAAFRTAVQARWKVIYPYLQTVVTEIDHLADENRLSDKYNQAMWPLMNEKVNQNTAWNGDEDLTFEQSINLMKQIYQERLSWMNSAITGGNFVINAE